MAKLRWHWWQFWRPKYPRPCLECRMFAPLHEGAWLQHKYQHWLEGPSLEARLARVQNELRVVHQHTHEIMQHQDAMFEAPPKDKLN